MKSLGSDLNFFLIKIIDWTWNKAMLWKTENKITNFIPFNNQKWFKCSMKAWDRLFLILAIGTSAPCFLQTIFELLSENKIFHFILNFLKHCLVFVSISWIKSIFQLDFILTQVVTKKKKMFKVTPKIKATFHITKI